MVLTSQGAAFSGGFEALGVDGREKHTTCKVVLLRCREAEGAELGASSLPGGFEAIVNGRPREAHNLQSCATSLPRSHNEKLSSAGVAPSEICVSPLAERWVRQ
jgi:hypothetical protein